MQGTVITAQPHKGYFFVQPDGGTRRDNHFAHISNWGFVPQVGAKIEFESQRDERGLLAVPAGGAA
jgi:cold shock CspA family protein